VAAGLLSECGHDERVVQDHDNLVDALRAAENPLESRVRVAPQPIESGSVLESPTAPGTGRLRFARRGGRTIVERVFAKSPLKILTTGEHDAACWAYGATFGGGIVGGDALDLRVDVRSDARALLTTQASTKIYRSQRPASQRIVARVEERGLLAVVPDPIVCFAGAHFTQIQLYDLSENASLVLVDWMTSGRHASGERWAFDHYSSRIDIRRAGRLLLHDAIVLCGTDGSIAERLGAFDATLTAVITGPVLGEAASEIVRTIASAPISVLDTPVLSAWPLRDGGAMIRMCGRSTEAVSAAIRRQLSFLPSLLGDDPWSRKW